jgi:pyruvate/2-oxoglutarate dehydrogenase complex dihydrolipoamide dehydrogenase (E3) component
VVIGGGPGGYVSGAARGAARHAHRVCAARRLRRHLPTSAASSKALLPAQERHRSAPRVRRAGIRVENVVDLAQMMAQAAEVDELARGTAPATREDPQIAGAARA